MKQHRLLLPLLILLLIFVACRREWLPTEEDFTDYGWTLYQDGRFKESNHWFQNAIDENMNYKDGYNGMGWSEQKMSLWNTEPNLDNAIGHFKEGLKKDDNPRSLHNVDFDLFAGLTFSYSIKDPAGSTYYTDSTIFYGDSLIKLINEEQYEQTWYFPHDTTTDYLDIHVTLAWAKFLKKQYNVSLEEHVRLLEDKCGWPTISPDFQTATGIHELAARIEELGDHLYNNTCR
jgi:tetratricopeptide (TPR) repeat protein